MDVQPHRIAVIGIGAIGEALFRKLKALPNVDLSVVVRPGSKTTVAGADAAVLCDVAQLLAFEPDIVIECAGHEALAQFGVPVLDNGARLVVASVGALADTKLEADLLAAARRGRGALHVVPGAFAGLDALSAVPKDLLGSVTYSGTKPLSAWVGSAAETLIDLNSISSPMTFFKGSAREAARLFPKNANVVAALAMAGLGFDETQACLSVDTAAEGNIHRFVATGAFGEIDVRISSKALAGNVKSSALTPDSLFRAVQNMIQPLVI